MSFFVLGFTAEDVITAEQDCRLASECVRAWRAAGRPQEFEILQGPGEGDHLLFWYVSEASALILDGQRIDWRRFLVAENCPAPPPRATPALSENSQGRP